MALVAGHVAHVHSVELLRVGWALGERHELAVPEPSTPAIGGSDRAVFVQAGPGFPAAGLVCGPRNLAQSAEPIAAERDGKLGEPELRDESAGEDGRVQSGHESHLVQKPAVFVFVRVGDVYGVFRVHSNHAEHALHFHTRRVDALRDDAGRH